MKEETKQRLKSVAYFALATLMGGVLTLITMGVVGCSMQNQAKTDTTAYTTLKGDIDPKRAQDGQAYTITNIGSGTTLELWANGYVNHRITSGSTQNFIWSNSTTYTAKYEDESPFVAGTSGGSNNLHLLDMSWVVEYSPTIFITKQNPTYTIENDFMEATNEAVMVMPEGYTSLSQSVLTITNGESETIDYETLKNKIVIKVAQPVGSPYVLEQYRLYGDNTLLYTGGTWNPTGDVLVSYYRLGRTTLTITPLSTYYTCKNNTTYTIEYILVDDPTDPNPDYTTEYLSAGQTLRLGNTARVDFFADHDFTLDYNGSTYRATKSQTTYYLVIDDWSANGVINDPHALNGDAGEVLTNTFIIISQGFSALLPILNMQIMENMTIGLLLFIPLTFAIVVLIVKLIKM